MLNRILLNTLVQSALIFILVTSLASLAFGTALLLRRDWALRFSTYMSQWVSTRKLMLPLEQTRNVDHHLYRRHSWVGAFIVCGAIYVLYFLFLVYRPDAFLAVFGNAMPPRALRWLLDSLWWMVLVTNISALIIGLIVFFRPSALKGLESWSNRIVSTRKASKSWETMNLKADGLVHNNPRLFGWFIVLGSLYVVATFGALLIGRWGL